MVSSFQLANHVVGIMIDRDITDDYLQEIHEIVLARIDEFGKINFFCEVLKGNHIPFMSLMEELKFKYDNSQQIDKVAVVTDRSLLRSVMSVTDLFLHSEIKTYELSERLDAITWVSQINPDHL